MTQKIVPRRTAFYSSSTNNYALTL